MPRVICALPNASDLINGVKFHLLEDGRRISDEIDEAAAELFASIPGYELDDGDQEPAKEPEKEPAPTLTKAQQRAKEKAEKEAAAKAAEEAAEKAAAADGSKTETEEEVF